MKQTQTGQALAVSIIVLSVILVLSLALFAGSLTFFTSSKYSVESLQALNLAEAGIDKAVATLNKSAGAYYISTPTEVVNLGIGEAEITVLNKDANTKIISSTGYVPNKTNPKSKRAISIETARGSGFSFAYGLQVGDGGLEMGSNNTIIGSVYSNGNVMAGNEGNKITGDLYVAGGGQPTPDQSFDCTSCADEEFGRFSDQEMDLAQSFKANPGGSSGTPVTLNKIALKLKKVGNPLTSLVVKIVNDSNGVPDKNQNNPPTGTISPGIVGTSYPSGTFIEVTFNSSPTLLSQGTYWIVVDNQSSNNSNYWHWQKDLNMGYANGEALWSSNCCSTGNPSWQDVSADLSFQTFLGGVATSVEGSNGLLIEGDAYANTLKNLKVDHPSKERKAYYKTEQNIQVNGLSCNSNPSCIPNSPDPPPQVFSISDAVIDDWKENAEDANPNLGNPSCGNTWGPGKYNGNITIGNNCTLTVKTPIWITGNLNLGNSNKFNLDPSYGNLSGNIIVSGKTRLGNTNNFNGVYGNNNSILSLVSTHDSTTNPNDPSNYAVVVDNGASTGYIYSTKGVVDIGNGNSFKELTAWKIRLQNGVTLTYSSGLSGFFFSSGPTGSYSLIKGTYQNK